MGMHTISMNRLPMGCLVLFLYSVFLTTPVMASPKAMNAGGIIAIQGFPSMVHSRKTVIAHMRQKDTSFRLSLVWNQYSIFPVWCGM